VRRPLNRDVGAKNGEMMKMTIILLMGLIPLAGCTSTRVAPTALLPPPGYHSVGDPLLTPQDARAVAVAREYFEKESGNSVEAYYQPRKLETGYYVVVNYIVRNDSGEVRLTGPISSVRISDDWQKVDLIRW